MTPRIAAAVAFAAAFASASELGDLVEGLHWKRAQALVEARLPASGGASAKADFLWRASQVRLAHGDLEGAAKFAEQAAELDPGNSTYQVQLFEVYGSQAEKASLLRQASLGRKCKKALDRALELNRNDLDGLYGAMLFYYQAPGFFGGDKTKARAIPAAMAAIDPVRGILAEARLAQMEGRLDRLEGIYLRAVEAGPADYHARMELANFYLSGTPNRKLHLAENHAREASRLRPGRAAPYAILASAAALAGRFADAQRHVAAAVEAVPDNLAPQLAGASALITTGADLASAEKWCRAYLAQRPQPDAPPHAIARWRLAQALAKLGRRAEAAREIAEARRLLPKHDGIRADYERLKSARG
ncbi:MAG: hypothetical protein R2729_07200 [Bryobacteraceae bacterium]